ncbi:MAG: ATP-binding protein [Clostridia bacterium]|nr:ATP-binding protein [Clostridia bacterium]
MKYNSYKTHRSMLMRLSSCNYIDNCHHVILTGASGRGKSYIACALSNAVCQKFYHVRYVRMKNLWMR